VTVFDVLSALMLTTCSKKGLVMTAKQAPWMCPWKTQILVQFPI